MAEVGVEEDPAVQAARILLTLRSRRLLRWPEWVEKEAPAAAVVEVRWPLEGWPKRQRSGRRLPSDWRSALALPKLGLVVASSASMMKASSPETPLDFDAAAAAGSGASSSWDDAARPPSKLRAPGAVGSGGGASSGDEGCSSPDKRARVDAVDSDGEKAISEPKIQAPDNCEKGIKFVFDLNMPCPEDDFC